MLEGREAGTRGYDIAASYVATQLRLIGLEPAGNAAERPLWYEKDFFGDRYAPQARKTAR